MSAPQRQPDGRFLPGFTPNPSGRPKGIGAIRELARQYVPAALKKIVELIESRDEKIALAASREVLDRVFGKPVQAVEAETKTLDMTKLYLEALKAANARPIEPVDVTPADAAIEHDQPAELTEESATDW